MKENILVKDKEFMISISAEELDRAVSKIANDIKDDLKDKDPVFLIILNGAFMFASDLMKKLDFPLSLSFLKLASYEGTSSSGHVKQLFGFNEDLSGRNVVVVEDIIDSGVTMASILKQLKALNVADVKIASLLFKPAAFMMDFPIDYIGLEIPNDFIVGYGLDYDAYGRNYPDIYRLVH